MGYLDDFIAQVTPNTDHQLYLKIITVFCVTFILLKVIGLLAHQRMKAAAKRTGNNIDDLIIQVLDSFGFIFYFTVSLFVVTAVINIDQDVSVAINKVSTVVFTYYAIKALAAVSNYGFKRALKVRQAKDERFDPTVLKILNTVVKAILWLVGVLLVLQNLGYNVTAVLGGIGVLGIAIAFGLQNILQDVFAFFSIYFDKPFKVGDFIVIGEGDKGTVKKIGIRSTRIKTLQGEELVISNEDLTNTRINNYRKLNKRRVEFKFGVTYNTPSSKLKKIPMMVEKIINDIEAAEFSRTHFKQFGEFSLVFEVVYYVTNPDYRVHMDIQQQINLQIKDQLERAKIEMALPTQTLFVQGREDNK